MRTDYKEAVIAFAQSLDADWATDEDRDRAKKRLVGLIENIFGGSVFAIAMKRLVEGCR